MASHLSQLESRYINVCRKHEVPPNTSILSSFLKHTLASIVSHHPKYWEKKSDYHGILQLIQTVALKVLNYLCSDAGLSEKFTSPNVVFPFTKKVKEQKSRLEPSCLEIVLDNLAGYDFPPLIYSLSDSDLSDIDSVDVRQKSFHPTLNGEYLLPLFSAVNQKLRVVDLLDWSSCKDVLRHICGRGITCQILKFCFSPIRKLNLNGKFTRLHTLYLDFNVHLSSFDSSCFDSMPNLMRLSMCETKMANLWMTSASLAKLQSLVELRFQNCLCCYDTGACRALLKHVTEDSSSNYSSSDDFVTSESTSEDSLDGSDMDFVSDNQGTKNWKQRLYDSTSRSLVHTNEDIALSLSRQLSFSASSSSSSPTTNQLLEEFGHNDHFSIGNETLDDQCYSTNSLTGSSFRTSDFPPQKHNSAHPSPICFEKYYREYMIVSLPKLNILDNLPIGRMEREQAEATCRKYFQHVPYDRDNILTILRRREMGNSACVQKSRKSGAFLRENCHSISRSLSAAKAISSPWPNMRSISKLRCDSSEEVRTFRPRQFEYHPSDPRLMVFGTLDGEVVVINHESEKLVGFLPSDESVNGILGLCWLRSCPSLLIAGSDDGSLGMYDVHKLPSEFSDEFCTSDASVHTFDKFEQLTSVHVNSTDEVFLASGFSTDVALYDIGSGKRIQVFNYLHQEHINVVKFSHHWPSVFATASFDRNVKLWDLRQGVSHPCYTASSSRGNVMVCFSPDDRYLLASAIDNEVNQLLAVDGRHHMTFNIPSIGSAQNYTRAYYLNGGDYIVTGSCEEHVVRICCSQTGRRLKDITLEGKGSRNLMYVQSLRGDLFRPFHMSILARYPHTKPQIIKINLLESEVSDEERTCTRSMLSSSVKGG